VNAIGGRLHESRLVAHLQDGRLHDGDGHVDRGQRGRHPGVRRLHLTSEGEVAVYQGGTIRRSTSGWNPWSRCFALAGRSGRRCFEKVGADLVVITSDGAFPLSKAMLTDRVAAGRCAVVNKIVNLINGDVVLYGSNYGWQIVLYPLGNKLIMNVPADDQHHAVPVCDEHDHRRLCRFTGWNATASR
jgi:hypothetical protein